MVIQKQLWQRSRPSAGKCSRKMSRAAMATVLDLVYALPFKSLLMLPPAHLCPQHLVKRQGRTFRTCVPARSLSRFGDCQEQALRPLTFCLLLLSAAHQQQSTAPSSSVLAARLVQSASISHVADSWALHIGTEGQLQACCEDNESGAACQ